MTETNGVTTAEGDQPPREDSGMSGGETQVVENGVSGSGSESKEKHHSSSSSKHGSSSSKHHSSSGSKHHSSSSSKHHSSSSSKHHSSSSSKDKHHSSSSSKHGSSSSSKHHSSSSSSKDKDKDRHSSSKHSSSSSSSKHHSSSKDKDKHHSSSSSSKDKDKHSSSKDKDRHSSSKHHSSSSSKDKDRHSSSKDKDRHSSSSKHKSSSKDKDRHSSSKHHSSSSSKHRDGDKEKHSESKPTENHVKTEVEDGLSPKMEIKTDFDSDFKVKVEPESALKAEDSAEEYEDTYKREVKDEVKEELMDSEDDVPLTSRKEETNHVKMEEDSEDDAPISSRKQNNLSYKEESDEEDDAPLSKRKSKASYAEEDDDYEEDDVPLKARKGKASYAEEEDDFIDDGESDDEPLSSRKKAKKTPAKKRKAADSDDDVPLKKKKAKATPVKKETASPTKKLTKAQKEAAEAGEKWKWWEEEQKDDGTKWRFLEHKGPVFAPEYEPLPRDVKFFYDGEHMQLTPDTEEVATFYGRMLDHDYTTKDIFNKNFFKDWRSVMTSEEKKIITDLSKCNFKQILLHFKEQSERRKAAPKEEKNKIKEQNAAIQAEYGFCQIDGHQEKIGNFRIEPPGLFRGRGTHPKMGMLKKRTMPENVIINCSKDAKVPDPPEGHRWKEVRHDNTVTWLACWTENVQGQTKYVMLNPASKLKGQKDWAKYEVARNLHKCVDKIRANYYEDFKSKEMRIRQRSVAMYFIDKLALRAGNEKDEETADTVGCCSLRVEHLRLHEEMEGKPFVVEFDFLGKDSIRYYNKVAVEKRVFKNLQLFMDNKNEGDDLFDRLNTAVLNKHLQGLMDGLTAKVFRTYNASKTLQEQLDLLTNPDDPVPSKLLSYNRANRKVAILCNHQRAAPKNFDKQMENLQVKIEAKRQQVKEAKKQAKEAKAEYKAGKSDRNKMNMEKKKKALERIEMQLTKLEVAATDKDENKEIALGTSKLNYLDPRISVGWCKKWDVPVEKIYNKTQRDKFAWAIDMADEDFKF